MELEAEPFGGHFALQNGLEFWFTNLLIQERLAARRPPATEILASYDIDFVALRFKYEITIHRIFMFLAVFSLTRFT